MDERSAPLYPSSLKILAQVGENITLARKRRHLTLKALSERAMIFNFGAACFRATGEGKRPLIVLLIAGALNVSLNLLFVLGFKMQTNGQDVLAVGLTTLISQAVQALLIVIFLHRSKNPYSHLEYKGIALYKKETQLLLKHDHKKVLFVSEKLAALNVVYNNLKKAGLTDFALELHSDKSDKQAVFGELAKSLYAYKTSLSEQEKDDIDDLIAARKELDFYAKSIHDPTSFGNKSVYELISAYEELSPIPSLSYVSDGIASKDLAYYKDATVLLERYEGYSKFFGYDYRKAELKDLELPLLSYEEKTHLLFCYNDAINALKELQPLSEKEAALLGKKLSTAHQAFAFLSFALAVKDTPFDDASFYKEAERSALIAELKKCQQIAARLTQEEQKLASLVTPKESLEALDSLLQDEKKGYGLFPLLNKTRKANTERLKTNVKGGRTREEKLLLLQEYVQEQHGGIHSGKRPHRHRWFSSGHRRCRSACHTPNPKKRKPYRLDIETPSRSEKPLSY